VRKQPTLRRLRRPPLCKRSLQRSNLPLRRRKPVAHEQPAASEDAIAKARNADAKRAMEKRKLERRQQWAERRWHQTKTRARAAIGRGKVREETEPRQEFAPEPARVTRVIRLFGPE